MESSSLELAKQRMLRKHLQNRGVHDPRVLAAMARVPREQFVEESVRDQAYDDRALPIDCGQTISQPFMVGLMSQALALAGTERVLEIGTGSGYQTAVLAELAREVFTIERFAELSRKAQSRLTALGYQNVTFLVGDGTRGYSPAAPYDRILVTAAAPHCPPALLDQLAEGGILVIPLGGSDEQVLQRIIKMGECFRTEDLCRCRFVPLVAGGSEETSRSQPSPG